MNFHDIYKIKDETERVQKTYELFNEDIRLNRSKAARVEFLTNVRYIEKYLMPKAKILDIGAGAGEYSIYFARKGYEVSAIELSETNIKAFRKKITPGDKIDLVQGNAVDLGRYDDESFDIVLLFGPLYHLKKEKDKQRCIAEAKRVCKPDGKIFFAFISNDMIILTEFSYNPNYFTNGDYDKETFRLEDFPFVFHTVDACREVLARGGIKILHEVASDGISELLEDKINSMDEESYAQYLRYHDYICEKKEFLGMTNHLLFVGEKPADPAPNHF
ncbi:MAG: class I SAM-dependent methyltransferase [Lachnospiraceae bacterium]